MSNFKFCKFYGLSAPLVVLLSDSALDEVLASVDSVSGFSLMKNLLLELQFLEKQFNESKVFQRSIDYEKLYNLGYRVIFDSKDLASFRKDYIRTSQHFQKSEEPFTLPNGRTLTKDAWLEVKEEFKNKGQQLSKQVKTSETITLDDNTYTALSLIYTRSMEEVNYMKKKMPRIAYLQLRISEIIKDNNLENLTLYENKVTEIASWEYLTRINQYLNKRYYQEFSTLTKKSIAFPCERCTRDIQRILNAQDKSTPQREPLPISTFVDLASYKTPVEVEMGIRLAVENGTVSALTGRDVKFNDRELFLFIANTPNYDAIAQDFNKYIDIEQFLNTITVYNADFFRKLLNLQDCTDEQIEKIFEDLADLHVIGLNLRLRDFFLEALRNVSLHSPVLKAVDVQSNEVVKENLELMLEDLASKQEFSKAGLVL